MKKIYVLGFAAAMLASVAACAPDYSSGDRVGTVYKLSEKGLFMKSWEGSMNLGGLRKDEDSDGNTTIVANTFDFSIRDPLVIKAVNQAMLDGKTVKLHYKQWFIPPPAQDTGYTIASVEVLN